MYVPIGLFCLDSRRGESACPPPTESQDNKRVADDGGNRREEGLWLDGMWEWNETERKKA